MARVGRGRPRVTVAEVTGNPILRGALLVALSHAREEVFAAWWTPEACRNGSCVPGG